MRIVKKILIMYFKKNGENLLVIEISMVQIVIK
jgi:hypothetical protein